MRISYAITVCNEYIELEQLLAQLNKFIQSDEAEVVILKDTSKDNEQVHKVIGKYIDRFPKVIIESRNFDNDFAAHKNYLNSKCTGEYIFQIDADEIPSSILLKELENQIHLLDNPDVIWVPRINIVNGLTNAWVKKWGWHIDSRGFVNFPDWQGRLYRNTKDIIWYNKVHEKLIGFSSIKKLPQDEKYALLHVKEIQRQVQQNELYDKLS
jgi:glycosyltransferase involved in cell wall biosynthesis